MINLEKKRKSYLKRKLRVKKTIRGASDSPRLNVYKSNRHIYAQIIDDKRGETLEASSSLTKELKEGLDNTEGKIGTAKKVGLALAKKAVSIGIKRVVFDRNGFLYHGRIKALAEGAREGGLKF